VTMGPEFFVFFFFFFFFFFFPGPCACAQQGVSLGADRSVQ